MRSPHLAFFSFFFAFTLPKVSHLFDCHCRERVAIGNLQTLRHTLKASITKFRSKYLEQLPIHPTLDLRTLNDIPAGAAPLAKMAVAGVDLAYLSGHLAIEQDQIATAATQPTVELVVAILLAIENRARELEAEQINKDVALEAIQRSAESQAEASKAQADQALREVEEARRRLQEEGMFAKCPHGVLWPQSNAPLIRRDATSKSRKRIAIAPIQRIVIAVRP